MVGQGEVVYHNLHLAVTVMLSYSLQLAPWPAWVATVQLNKGLEKLKKRRLMLFSILLLFIRVPVCHSAPVSDLFCSKISWKYLENLARYYQTPPATTPIKREESRSRMRQLPNTYSSESIFKLGFWNFDTIKTSYSTFIPENFMKITWTLREI